MRAARSGSAVRISRVSSKGQVTLPKQVRDAIGVGPGDAVAYDVVKGVVTLRRLEPIDLAPGAERAVLFARGLGAARLAWPRGDDRTLAIARQLRAR